MMNKLLSMAESYVKKAATYNYDPVTVPQHQYCVLGDYQNRSYDSHLLGFVLEQNIVGCTLLRISLSASREPLKHFISLCSLRSNVLLDSNESIALMQVNQELW